MDVKAYIDSGVLQDCALGVASEQELREVACLRGIYPEIDRAMLAIEEDLERFARDYAEEPPAELRERIMAAVASTDREPVLRTEKSSESPAQTRQKPIVRKADRRGGSGRWMAVAAAALLLGALAIWLYTENQQQQRQLAESGELLEQKTREAEQLSSEIRDLYGDLEKVYGAEMKKVMLEPVKEDSDTRLALMWDTVNGAVSIDISPLPPLPEDQQYQLWVLADGKPSSMGVLPKDIDGIVTAAGRAVAGQAFAITVEPLGGLPSPTLDQMVAMGNT